MIREESVHDEVMGDDSDELRISRMEDEILEEGGGADSDEGGDDGGTFLDFTSKSKQGKQVGPHHCLLELPGTSLTLSVCMLHFVSPVPGQLECYVCQSLSNCLSYQHSTQMYCSVELCLWCFDYLNTLSNFCGGVCV